MALSCSGPIAGPASGSPDAVIALSCFSLSDSVSPFLPITVGSWSSPPASQADDTSRTAFGTKATQTRCYGKAVLATSQGEATSAAQRLNNFSKATEHGSLGGKREREGCALRAGWTYVRDDTNPALLTSAGSPLVLPWQVYQPGQAGASCSSPRLKI